MRESEEEGKGEREEEGEEGIVGERSVQQRENG